MIMKLKFSSIEDPKKPKMDMCTCANCGWSGAISKCETDYEFNDYTYDYDEFPACPKCEDGGCIDDYWYSDKELEKLEVEKYNKMIQLD